jgi:hypothetical protein
MRRHPIHLATRPFALLLLAGCAPAVDTPHALPAVPGVYPEVQRVEPGPAPRPGRDAGWRAADNSEVRLVVDASAAAFLGGLPPTGGRVPVRTVAWPAPVRLGEVGEGGAAVYGDWIAPGLLAGDVRCDGGPGAGTAVRIAAELRADGAGLVIEVRYEGPEPLACEVSASGHRRLQSAAADLYLWARAIARAGTELPARRR